MAKKLDKEGKRAGERGDSELQIALNHAAGWAHATVNGTRADGVRLYD